MLMLNYDYTASEAFCKEIGLVWVPDLLPEADAAAKAAEFTQEQVDVAMRHHLWQIKWLFTPKNYSYWTRILMALHFLFSWK